MSGPERCSKCDGTMLAGFIIDQGYGEAHASTWQAGAPRKSFWMGVKQVKDQQMEVTSFRCERCGYLESYAKPQDDARS